MSKIKYSKKYICEKCSSPCKLILYFGSFSARENCLLEPIHCPLGIINRSKWIEIKRKVKNEKTKSKA